MIGDQEPASPGPVKERAVDRLVLFVAGDEFNSRLAKRNLAEICSGRRCEDFAVEIVDVLTDSALAIEHNILVTPTLLVLTGGRATMVIGNLSDRQEVRSALRWKE